MIAPLLTSLDAGGHIHLVIGTNSLASARCAKSIEVGAKPIIIAPTEEEVHYVLAKRIEEGQVEWLKKSFECTDLTNLGREEVDGIVDAVFVTSSGKNTQSMTSKHDSYSSALLNVNL